MIKFIQTHLRITLGLVLAITLNFTIHGQESQTVTGKVTTESGEPIPGVNVVEEGTSRGSITDASGNYTITVSENATLTFSFIGYLAEQVEVGSRSVVDIILLADIQQLDEIVVVGYGSQERKDLTSAVATVQVEDLKKLPGNNIGTMLQGQVAGLNAASGQGAPGSPPVLRVRGLSTISGNDPLVVVDGIPSTLQQVNPSDVESITVLKDAAAATIYGSRAANGVILITTKRGKVGVPQVSISSYGGISKLIKKVDVANRDQVNQIIRTRFEADGLTVPAFISESGLPDTDWQDEYFETAFEQKHDVNISGGSEAVLYNFSAGYFSQEGIGVDTESEQYNFRINTDFKISDRITIGQSLSYARIDRDKMFNLNEANFKGRNSSISPILELLGSRPHKPARDPNTSTGFGAPSDPQIGSGNIVGQQVLETNRDQDDRIQGNLKFEYKINDNFKIWTQIGANIYNEYLISHTPTYNFGPQATVIEPFLTELRRRTTETVWNNVLDFNKSFGQHHITALVGASAEKKIIQSTGGRNNNLGSDKLLSLGGTDALGSDRLSGLSFAVGDANSFGGNVESTLRSVFTRVGYNYADRYIVQLSLRSDGSSRFPSGDNIATFGSASIGWRISEEAFFNIPFISDLKPRFSYGTLGNQDIGDFAFLPVVTTATPALNYASGEDIAVGAISTSIPSKILWETTKTTNVGVDLGLLEDKITLTFDYFNIDTEDILTDANIPATSGFTTGVTENAGTMNNKGWELGIGYKKKTGDFQYSINANLTHTKNKVKKLGDPFLRGNVVFVNHPTTITQEGGQIAEFFLFKTDGIFQSQSEIDAHEVQPDAAPGDLRFVDVNNDGTLDDDDRTLLGTNLPNVEFGLTFNAQYKNLDLNIFFQGNEGSKMYNGTRWFLYRDEASPELVNGWTPSNTNTSVFRQIASDPNQNLRPSDYFLEDASYVRLKNVQLGYTIPDIGNKVNILSNARIYIGGENLITITDYSGYDPSVTNFELFGRGVDRGVFPSARRFVFWRPIRFLELMIKISIIES